MQNLRPEGHSPTGRCRNQCSCPAGSFGEPTLHKPAAEPGSIHSASFLAQPLRETLAKPHGAAALSAPGTPPAPEPFIPCHLRTLLPGDLRLVPVLGSVLHKLDVGTSLGADVCRRKQEKKSKEAVSKTLHELSANPACRAARLVDLGGHWYLHLLSAPARCVNLNLLLCTGAGWASPGAHGHV